MKSPAFRKKHLLQLFEEYGRKSLPMDVCLREYCRQNRALGSKDRRHIVDLAYGMIRWKALIDYQLRKTDPSWAQRLDIFEELNPADWVDDERIPLHVRYSCPKELMDLLIADYGREEACRQAWVNNTEAPTTVRANAIKIHRDTLLQQLRDRYPVRATTQAPHGITFSRRINFLGMEEFRAGLFEVQDEASQLAAARVLARPGQTVLDFCAGSGGKSLAFAPSMEGQGQIFLHDIRTTALKEARRRLRRAGVQTAQIVPQGDARLTSLLGRCDWVVVDAPCSGTGTLRRNPDMKWRFHPDWLQQVVEEQRQITGQALRYLKPNGRLVYLTCSVLKAENQRQIEYFQRAYSLFQSEEPFQALPQHEGMDGFFGATLKRR